MKSNEYYHAEVDVKDYPFESIKFNNEDYNRIVSLIRQFNKSKDKIVGSSELFTNLIFSFKFASFFN